RQTCGGQQGISTTERINRVCGERRQIRRTKLSVPRIARRGCLLLLVEQAKPLLAKRDHGGFGAGGGEQFVDDGVQAARKVVERLGNFSLGGGGRTEALDAH